MTKKTPHTVLNRPWTYKVAGLSIDYTGDPSDVRLELRLRNDEETVALLFSGVHELEIEAGFPWVGSGMEIWDESSRGMEYARIRVTSSEQEPAIHS